jgi:hypothetical protein
VLPFEKHPHILASAPTGSQKAIHHCPLVINPLVCLPNKKEQSHEDHVIHRKTTDNADDATTATTMSTQSGDDAQRPTAVAKVYLEDGTVLIGRSFGAHKSVEGEVRWDWKRQRHAHSSLFSRTHPYLSIVPCVV